MSKNLKYIFILLVIGLIASYVVYKYAMKPVADTTSLKTEITSDFNQISTQLSNNDTAQLNKMTNKVISVSGTVRETQNEDTLITVTLGDTSSSNAIICQADKRHLTDFNTLKVNDNVKLKGVCAGYVSDDLGLGASLQLKNCIKE